MTGTNGGRMCKWFFIFKIHMHHCYIYNNWLSSNVLSSVKYYLSTLHMLLLSQSEYMWRYWLKGVKLWFFLGFWLCGGFVLVIVCRIIIFLTEVVFMASISNIILDDFVTIRVVWPILTTKNVNHCWPETNKHSNVSHRLNKAIVELMPYFIK